MINIENIIYIIINILLLLCLVLIPILKVKKSSNLKFTGIGHGLLFYILIYGFIIGITDWLKGDFNTSFSNINSLLNGEINLLITAISIILSSLIIFKISGKTQNTSYSFPFTISFCFFGFISFQTLQKLVEFLVFSITVNLGGPESLLDADTSLKSIIEIGNTINNYDFMYYFNLILTNIFDFVVIFMTLSVLHSFTSRNHFILGSLSCCLVISSIYSFIIALSYLQYSNIVFVLLSKFVILIIGSLLSIFLIHKVNKEIDNPLLLIIK
ncbi:hypothetical protein EDD63_102119 [Breznakia blatticola]|uniref:Uncharacterized protein n=1 Tax=Breznakia blatticola TaxID=1754012 RepID=A0A4R8A8U5_9FIRM|nr:hypothetical protein [Breznakia blatticola]TDW26098.1 hypothetical protein EDD63_102119 [Breznakia blatticola]